MRLRNKKTGEVVEAFEGGPVDLYFYLNEHEGENNLDRKTYQSLAELNADWEDYASKEPLIKDEKIRKAVRAWAEALNIEYAEIIHDGSNCEVASYFCGLSIEFDETTIDIKDGHYTIAELCGEEE